jgi:hypothetical protein
MSLAEAVQLTRQDPSNIKRLVDGTVKKLTSTSVIVRVKALRFLNHLAQNGPAAVVSEIKLNTTAISSTMGFRGSPHPTRGWEPYQEMKDAAQTLLDLSFSAQIPQAQSFAVNNTSPTVYRGSGINSMEAYGSTETIHQSASLEPRNLDPNHRDLQDEVTGFFRKAFNMGPATPVASKYGAASNVPGGSQLATGYSTTSNEPYIAPAPVAPPPRGLMERLQPDVSWTRKAAPVAAKPVRTGESPTAKLLKVPGGRAIPTNGELSAYGAALTPDSVDELRQGLSDADWKVKVRAISGLEVYGGKYGLGPVATVKDQVEALKGAPQASLRTAATRFFEAIKDVEPTADPSAFDFDEAGAVEGEDAQGFDFGTE